MPWRERPGKIFELSQDRRKCGGVPGEGTSLIYIVNSIVDALEGEDFGVVALAYCPAAFRTYN